MNKHFFKIITHKHSIVLIHTEYYIHKIIWTLWLMTSTKLNWSRKPGVQSMKHDGRCASETFSWLFRKDLDRTWSSQDELIPKFTMVSDGIMSFHYCWGSVEVGWWSRTMTLKIRVNLYWLASNKGKSGFQREASPRQDFNPVEMLWNEPKKKRSHHAS